MKPNNLPQLRMENIKRTEPQVCENQHRYIPVNGKCLVCHPGMPEKKIKLCEWCSSIVVGNGRFCGKTCIYQSTTSKKFTKTCHHCDEPMNKASFKFCSLKCNEDYQANILRISKL